MTKVSRCQKSGAVLALTACVVCLLPSQMRLRAGIFEVPRTPRVLGQPLFDLGSDLEDVTVGQQRPRALPSEFPRLSMINDAIDSEACRTVLRIFLKFCFCVVYSFVFYLYMFS